MLRKSFFAFSIATGLLVAGGSLNALAQEKKPEEKGQTCEEMVAKPLSEDDLKKFTDEGRKRYAEEFKVCKEGVAGNTKAKNANEITNRVVKEGAEALKNRNYDVAIAKFDEGYNADTEYWGTAPYMLNSKAIALRKRGVDKYNAAVSNKDATARSAGKKEAASDFAASIDALQKSLAIFDKNTVPADPASAKNFNLNKYTAFADRADSYRLLLLIDQTKAPDAVKAYQEYIAIETDNALKNKAQLSLAQAIFATGDLDAAIPEYQKVLTADPNQPDALYDMGSTLVTLGGINNDNLKVKEGLSYFDRFLKAAPSTYDAAKIADAKNQIETNAALKSEEKKDEKKPGKKKN